MTTPARKWWRGAVALGVIFVLINIYELVFADGGWPQIVGVPIGITLVAVGIAGKRGWQGVRL
ncbi:MAG: hypothetical protein OEW52_03795 [Thermoleophilia bacterium]|nr:hypothetical protein [Thermoleophilia bacterium]MDH4339531.1 hypothetical protein [Thermoleophilia bacterium]MDH5280258.1 hypothetical protein [Thermoleophilia bacterium]